MFLPQLHDGRQHHEMLPAACTMLRKMSGRFSKELNIVFAFPKSIIQSQLAGHVLCLIQNQACQHGKTKHRLAPLELASPYHLSTANHPITGLAPTEVSTRDCDHGAATKHDFFFLFRVESQAR